MKRFILIVFGLAFIASLAVAGFVVVWYLSAVRPVSTTETAAKIFRLEPGTGTTQIAGKLHEQGLIRSANAFSVYISLHKLRGKLQAGAYSLSPSDSMEDIASKLSRGQVLTDKVVIPEGYDLAQIREVAVKKGIDGDDFDTAVRAKYPNSYLLYRPEEATLEGYLFPDSYTINGITTAQSLISQMLDTFDRQMSSDLEKAYTARGLTVHQAVTLASIVEKEVSRPEDRPVVAQIFLSRLKADIALGSDVTVIYASAKLGKPFDTKLDSPYNTYKYKGLPPGPICSPGLSALEAVAKPAATNYLYFLAGKDGHTYFAKDYAEHQSNIAKYLK